MIQVPIRTRPAAAILGLLLLGVSLLSTTVALGTVMVEVPIEVMARDADAIVHGRVLRTGVRLELGQGTMSPQTITTIAVDQWLAGQGGTTLTLRELGGVWQGGGQRYEGTAEFGVGDEVVLFLERRTEAPYDLRTFAMAQGRFSVRPGAPGVPSVVSRDLHGISFADLRQGEQRVLSASSSGAMELQAFLSYVRQARASWGAR